MNKRWYISALVIILVVLGGIASQEQNVTPNQEIVLQFTTDTVSSDEAQHAIATVKQQLQAVGVHDFQVTKYEGGQLKITYFSTADIASIKKMLSEEKHLGYANSSDYDNDIPFETPSKDSSIAYNLDVYEIQNGYDAAFNLSGKLALEHKTDNDRLSNTNPFANTKANEYRYLEQHIKVAYTFHRYTGITIDHKSNKIPEVRAGPSYKGFLILVNS